jgi:hypothetical protein
LAELLARLVHCSRYSHKHPPQSRAQNIHVTVS